MKHRRTDRWGWTFSGGDGMPRVSRRVERLTRVRLVETVSELQAPPRMLWMYKRYSLPHREVEASACARISGDGGARRVCPEITTTHVVEEIVVPWSLVALRRDDP